MDIEIAIFKARRVDEQITKCYQLYQRTKRLVFVAKAEKLEKGLDDFMAKNNLARCENCGEIVTCDCLIDTDELIANGGYGSVCENCNWH